jgi:surface protein
MTITKNIDSSYLYIKLRKNVESVFFLRLLVFKLLISALMFFTFQLSFSQNDFISVWNLSNAGTAGNNSISFITTNALGTINYIWQEISPGSASGSGNFVAGTNVTRAISGLPANATIRLQILPANLQRFTINNGTDRNRLVNVLQWGTTVWTSMQNAFRGCNNLEITATDVPVLTNVTDMSIMFGSCSILNGPSNINSWNTSAVNNMSSMFSGASAFNQNISSWNTAAVTNMFGMFSSASAF